MLIPKVKSAGDYRLQAAHIREFLRTAHHDDQLRAVLLDAAERLDQLADDAGRWESITIGENAAAKLRASGRSKQKGLGSQQTEEIEAPHQAEAEGHWALKS